MAEIAGDSQMRRMRGLDRAFEILEFLRVKRQPMRPNEIAAESGLPRSTVYQLINLLLDQRMLDYQGGDGRVFLGRRLYYLGTAYAQQFDLMRECELMLSRLAEETRETAQMCLLEGDKYTVAMMREGVRPFRISSNVGERVAIPWTASGRLLVSHMSDEAIMKLIPEDDFILPDGRRLPPDEFIAQARKARDNGYFTFNSEVENFTRCFAVPILQAGGDCVATLCLVAPREDGLRNRELYLQRLLAAAGEISEKLGYVEAANGTLAVANGR